MAGTAPDPEPGSAAQRTTDRLALALEDVGFDVGRAFPQLTTGRDREGVAVVELGTIAAPTADDLAAVLAQAAQHGITVPDAAP